MMRKRDWIMAHVSLCRESVHPTGLSLGRVAVSSGKALEERVPLTPVKHTTRHAFQPEVYHRSIVRHLRGPNNVHHVCAMRPHSEAISHGGIHVLFPTPTRCLDHRRRRTNQRNRRSCSGELRFGVGGRTCSRGLFLFRRRSTSIFFRRFDDNTWWNIFVPFLASLGDEDSSTGT